MSNSPSEPNSTKCTNRLLLLLLLLGSIAPVSAKRAAPVPVAPVVADGVRYSAPPEAMGFVVASDAGGKELWRVRVYKVTVDPNLEADVQHVFITTLALKDGILTVTDERGSRVIDPSNATHFNAEAQRKDERNAEEYVFSLCETLIFSLRLCVCREAFDTNVTTRADIQRLAHGLPDEGKRGTSAALGSDAERMKP